MLSVAKVGSSGGAANYYTDKDNFYFLGENSTEWFGNGAKQLGLVGSVNKDDFQAVLEGRLPDGSDLTYIRGGENRHQAGYDLTFSAPKSVSILALVEGDKSVLEAHQSAVKRTLSEIETLISTRTMIDGIPFQKQTNSLVSALFMHDTSRNLDPQLHTHAILANATFDSENGWKTLSSDRIASQHFVATNGFTNTIWKNQVAFGAIYRQFLKEDLAKQGYEFETVGKNGLWEIKGVPTEIFSSRRQEILEATEPNASNRSLSVATKDTRQAKDFSDMDLVRQDWKQKLAETGFQKEAIKTHQPIQQNDETERPQVELDQAVAEAIQELSKRSIKFSYDSLMTKVVNRIEAKEGVVLDVREAINRAIKEGELIATDKEQSYFTTKDHLENENVVGAFIAKLNHQTHQLIDSTQTVIGSHLATDQKNFNLFSVRGGIKYEAKLLGDIEQLATDNGKKHVIIVPDKKLKYDLLNENGKQGDIYTVRDYLESEQGSGKVVTLYRAEKISLDQMKSVLQKSYLQNDIVSLLDTGGGKNSGLARDIANSLGIDEIRLNERNESKRLIVLEGIDKNERLDTAVKAYTTLAFNKQNAVIQAKGEAVRGQLITKIRSALLEGGLLSAQNETVIRSKQNVFVADYKDRRNYKIGYTLEHKENGRIESFKIQSISDKQNKLGLVNERTGEVSAISVSRLNSSYSVFKEIELEVRVGEKLKSTGSFRDIRHGQELSVVGIKKGNFLFREKLLLQDDKGREFAIPTNQETRLAYNYVEAFGASKTGKRDSIIAVVGQMDLNSQTVNDIKRGGQNVVMITSASKNVVQSKVHIDDSQITVTDSLKNLFEAENLKELQQKFAQNDETLNRAIDLHIEKATLESRGKMTFNALKVMISLSASNQNIRIDEIRQNLIGRIQRGELIALGRNESLGGEFITRENVELENKLLKLASDQRNSHNPLLKSLDNVNFDGLTSGQKESASMILGSTDGIMLIQGYAGVGKTTQLRTVVKALSEQRPDVKIVGIAPTHTATKELRSAGVSEAFTVAQFLKDEANNTVGKGSYYNQVFVIDESSMIGSESMVSLLDSITKGGGRAVLSGDYAQLKSFESGSPLKLLYDRGMLDKSVMSEIVRQEADLKSVVEYAIKGAVPRSLVEIIKNEPSLVQRSNLDTMPTESLVDLKGIDKDIQYSTIAKDYVGRTEKERQNTVVITPLNADRQALNEHIHFELKEQNILGQKSLNIPIYEAVRATQADITDPYFWKEQVGNVVKQGEQYFTIVSADENGLVSLRGEDGDKTLDSQRLNVKTTAIYRQNSIEITEGESIRFTSTDRDRVASNNAFGSVQKIDDEKVFIQVGDKTVIYDPVNAESDRHLDYGYVVTAFASQGGSFRNIIMYESENRAVSGLDSYYVEVSRGKHHIQAYIEDIAGYVEHIVANTGDRPNAIDLLDLKKSQDLVYNEREIVVSELKLWNNSAILAESKLGERLPASLVENGHFLNERSEVILQVLNENGSHRGNYHIPVNPYRGEVDYQEAYYQGASDGSMIVLNQGDEQKEIIAYSLKEIEKAISSEISDQTILVKLSDTQEVERLQDVFSLRESDHQDLSAKIAEALLEADDKALLRDAKQLDVEAENESREQRKSEFTGFKEENNILQHSEDKQVKEKELV